MVMRMARDLGYTGIGGVWGASSYIENYTGWLLFACDRMRPGGDYLWFFQPRHEHAHNDHTLFHLKYSEYLC